MTTRTLTPREMSNRPLDELIAFTRRHWPADAKPCPVCDGSGEATHGFPNDMPLTDRCSRCVGFGYLHTVNDRAATS